MSIFAALISDVIIATGRSDLEATGDIGLAIRRATLKAHSMAFWPMDLAEGVVLFADAAARNQSINVATHLDRFRAVKYIREYPSVSSTTGADAQFYTKQDPDAILDAYGQTMNNIWYLGGSNINLRSRGAGNTGVSIGWYQHPLVSSAVNYASWIADSYPFAIVDEAARMIFKNTGNMDMAAAYDQVMREHFQFMIQNYNDGEGR